jgi:hypothetical protein
MRVERGTKDACRTLVVLMRKHLGEKPFGEWKSTLEDNCNIDAKKQDVLLHSVRSITGGTHTHQQIQTQACVYFLERTLKSNYQK